MTDALPSPRDHKLKCLPVSIVVLGYVAQGTDIHTLASGTGDFARKVGKVSAQRKRQNEFKLFSMILER
jgi:hypothetical protein